VLEQAFSRVKEKCRERWTPAFILSCLEAGTAGLFQVHDDGDHMGWVVVERYDQGEPWLNVWIIEGAGLERAQEVLPLIDDLARSVGCVAWRCTGRKGWESIGLRPIATVYEREL
jgi:hypothetical protein